MKSKRLVLIAAMMVISAAIHATAQEPEGSATPMVVPTVQDGFHKSVIKAISKLRREGKIARRQALRLRVRMLSPSFRKHAEDLAITQMEFSGEEGIPMNANGGVNRAAIDWDALLAFLERLVPILLQLIQIFETGDEIGFLLQPTILQQV